MVRVTDHPDMTIAVYPGCKTTTATTMELAYPVSSSGGAPVAQWVKGWPIDLTVRVQSLLEGEIFSTVNRVPLHTAFHYHPPIVLI